MLPTYYNKSIAELKDFAKNATHNITLVIPKIKINIMNTVSQQQDYINQEFECQTIATDVYLIRDGVCGKLITFLDSQWLAFAVLAVWTLIGIPTIIINANVFAFRRVPRADAEYDGKKGDSKEKKRDEQPPPSIKAVDGVQQTKEIGSPIRPPAELFQAQPSVLSMRQVDAVVDQVINMNGTTQSIPDGLDHYEATPSISI